MAQIRPIMLLHSHPWQSGGSFAQTRLAPILAMSVSHRQNPARRKAPGIFSFSILIFRRQPRPLIFSKGPWPQNLRTIVYCKVKTHDRTCKAFWARRVNRGPWKNNRISAYRGRFLAEERRETSKPAWPAATCWPLSASALELGITDIGGLDLCAFLSVIRAA